VMTAAVLPATQEVGSQAFDPRAPRRVRHESRRRKMTVTDVAKIAPQMIRVTLTGDLQGFVSLGFDDHVKLFLSDGQADAGNARSIMRDFTPRRYDIAAGTLEIDFAIHNAGPATRWAEHMTAGQMLTIGGPRGSFVIPTAYDWHLLISDETGLPAIGRRLAELPAGARVVALCEVDGIADELQFETAANATVIWAHRNGDPAGTSDVLAKVLANLKRPAGDFYAWVACESLIAKALRHQLLAELGANPKWMRAAGYWRRGAIAVHDTHDD
jgi:NADPH-dependent ferric siderophore reductase